VPELEAEGIDGYREPIVGPYRVVFAIRPPCAFVGTKSLREHRRGEVLGGSRSRSTQAVTNAARGSRSPASAFLSAAM